MSDNLLDQMFEGVLSEDSGLKPSELQQAIYDAGENSNDNIIIQAVAGSGKSTTLRELTKHLGGMTYIVAFNRDVKEDMNQKLTSEGSPAKAMTFNGIGHGVVMRNSRSSAFKVGKLRDIVRSILDPSEYKEHGYALQRAVGLAKNNGMGISGQITRDDFVSLFENYDLNIDSKKMEYFSARGIEAFNRSVSDVTKFDYDDQLWLPVSRGWRFPRMDNLCVDEFQDLTPIQHMMIDLIMDNGVRLFGVGDRHQAIYGFRGALSDSMDMAKAHFSMRELPLSVTYRCPTTVVKEAQQYCLDIQAREGAPTGQVLIRQPNDYGIPDTDPELFDPALVMCRNNAPLFKAILRHVRAKRPCRVLTNFLESFKGFINGFKTTTTLDLLRKLENWYETEAANAKAKKFWGRLESLTDKYETARLLCDEYTTTSEVLGLLDRLALGTSGPTFSTIHKAKGLEHDHAYLLRPDLIPAQYARSPEQLQQEDNLMYVAITRAKSTFTYGETQL